MKYTRALLLSAVMTGVLGAAAPRAGAQPMPPPPPGLPAPPMMGDLHVRVVPQAPPRRRHEVRSRRPDRNHLWVNGFWHHTGQEWNWSDGRWAERPQARARWIAPRYRRVRGGYQYIPGHWSNQRVIYR